jgi:hypothetical protein
MRSVKAAASPLSVVHPETIGAHQHGSDDVRGPWAGPPVSNRSKGIRSADERIRCRGKR